MPASPTNSNARLSLTFDLIERAALVIFFGAMSYAFLHAWQATGNIANLILLVSEGSVVVLVLIRRRTRDISLQPRDWLVAVGATTAPLFVRPAGGEALAPVALCVALMMAGFALQIAAKWTLWRSFGVVPANRGVKVSGPYRLVRHPMYAGYMVAQIGFLVANPSAWNFAVYAIAFAFQIWRIMAEERLLGGDPIYRQFSAAVPYRLAPRIF